MNWWIGERPDFGCPAQWYFNGLAVKANSNNATSSQFTRPSHRSDTTVFTRFPEMSFFASPVAEPLWLLLAGFVFFITASIIQLKLSRKEKVKSQEVE